MSDCTVVTTKTIATKTAIERGRVRTRVKSSFVGTASL